MSGLNRLKAEFQDLHDNPLISIGCCIGLIGNDYYKWTCTLRGPDGTPYKDGIFQVQFEFPQNYPEEGPVGRFVTKIYHLNVRDSDGKICINYLNSWDPKRKMKDVLLAVFALFNKQNPESPWDSSRADLYKNNRNEFDRQCRICTKKYASY